MRVSSNFIRKIGLVGLGASLALTLGACGDDKVSGGSDATDAIGEVLFDVGETSGDATST